MVTTLIDSRRAWNIAAQVPDPEMPMLTLADLGCCAGSRSTRTAASSRA